MQSLARMKKRYDDLLIIIGLVTMVMICSIPFQQEIEITKVEKYTSSDQYHIETSFGGPRVTWIKVVCNRTAEILFMHETGVWVSTETVLLASFSSAVASYNFQSEHSTYIVEISSDGPVQAYIIYRYLFRVEISIFERGFYVQGQFPLTF